VSIPQPYTITDLGTLGGTSEANAINEDGWVAGTSAVALDVFHAFLCRNGTMTDLGRLTTRRKPRP
jgi:probable HAF family extracellular repeat protein